MDVYTGRQIVDLFVNIQNDEFADDRVFKLVKINKEDLHDKICCDGVSLNFRSYNDWLNDEDNYDNYHTETIDTMIEYVRRGGILPPLVVNKDLGLYDGQHRLTAYSMMDEVTEVEIFKEV